MSGPVWQSGVTCSPVTTYQWSNEPLCSAVEEVEGLARPQRPHHPSPASVKGSVYVDTAAVMARRSRVKVQTKVRSPLTTHLVPDMLTDEDGDKDEDCISKSCVGCMYRIYGPYRALSSPLHGDEGSGSSPTSSVRTKPGLKSVSITNKANNDNKYTLQSQLQSRHYYIRCILTI